MQIINESVLFRDIWGSKEIDLGDILKIVVDVEKRCIGIDAEMHSDIEEILLEQGSNQKDLWGANLVSSEAGYEIEYTSFINIRPAENNRAMEIEDQTIRSHIQNIIEDLIKY